MTGRPYVLLSCAVSADGCLDAAGPQRLILSGSEDLDRVDAERAGCDAIMVGAGTIRRDDPRLLIRSPARRAARAAQGLPEHPAGVTLTATGGLDPGAQFFTAGRDVAARAPQRLVYCAGPVLAATRARLAGLAEVADAGTLSVDAGDAGMQAEMTGAGKLAEIADAGGPAQMAGAGGPLVLPAVLSDLARRGVRRLMVEGGASLGGQLLAGGLVDELQLVIAPFFVGDPAAPRFAPPGSYPHGPGNPMVLTEVRRLGPVVLLRYLLGPGALAGGPDGPGGAGGPGGPGAGPGAGPGETGRG